MKKANYASQIPEDPRNIPAKELMINGCRVKVSFSSKPNDGAIKDIQRILINTLMDRTNAPQTAI